MAKLQKAEEKKKQKTTTGSNSGSSYHGNDGEAGDVSAQVIWNVVATCKGCCLLPQTHVLALSVYA